jgi:HAD superfamily hydrolase (TIGR01549 family)
MAKHKRDKSRHNKVAILFDLDGTLIDSVYQHALAWGEALHAAKVDLPNWMIHRKIGMSDQLIVKAFLRDAEAHLSSKQIERLREIHGEAYAKRAPEVRPLQGARKLLSTLLRAGIPHAIATSSPREHAERFLRMLHIDPRLPVITGDEVSKAKPEPDLFLAAADRLDAKMENCMVVGDSVWDLLAAKRARAVGVGLLCGGFGQDELERAGAYRVYAGPADLLAHLDEIGVQL